MLRQLAPELWVADQQQRFLGIEIGARMTVVRLAGSRLLLHSPISHSRELAEQVERLGSPTFIVAPNRFHHLYVHGWSSAYPNSLLYAAPGVEAKRPDLRISAVLGESPLPDWSDVLDQGLVAGYPLANEVVFFHRPTCTLIASDLVFNVGPGSPPLTRLAFRISGSYGRLSSTVLERLLVRDRAAFRSSLAKILRWPIARIVIAHGAVVEAGGRAALAGAYSWLLRGDEDRAA